MIGKLIAILVMGVAIWIAGNQMYGSDDNAFGGLFSDDSAEAQAANPGASDGLTLPPSNAQAVRKMVERAQKAQEENYQRILDQEKALLGQ